MCENLVSDLHPTKSFYRKDVEAILGSYVDGSPLDRIVRELEPMGQQVFDVVVSQIKFLRFNREKVLVGEMLAIGKRLYTSDSFTRFVTRRYGDDAMILRYGDDPVPNGYEKFEIESYDSYPGTGVRLSVQRFVKEEFYGHVWHHFQYGT